MSTFCSMIRCNEEKDTIVGTSTSCSASCVSCTAMRIRTSSSKILQLFHRLRHRCSENLHRGTTAHEVDNVLHGVPLDLLLRPDASEAVRPRPGGMHFFGRQEKSTQCLPPGLRCSGTWPCSVVLLVPTPALVNLHSDRAMATLIRAYFKYAHFTPA